MSKPSLKDKLNGNELDLSLSEIVDVPVKEISEIPKATHVDLSCNKIEFLPSSFASLTFLVHLDLSKNKLTELPTNFGCLRHLQHLDLYSNELTMLPVSFSQLKSLKWLDLKNNPLEANLKKAAGDCLDLKQCQQCAVRVVSVMQEIQSNLERERQKRLKEERALEAARKAEEERELQRQRQMKKAEKEKRKAKARNKSHSDETSGKQQTEQQTMQNGRNKDISTISPSKTKGSFSGSFIRILFYLLVLVPALLFLTHVVLNLSKGPVPSSVAGTKFLCLLTDGVLLILYSVILTSGTVAMKERYWGALDQILERFSSSSDNSMERTPVSKSDS